MFRPRAGVTIGIISGMVLLIAAGTGHAQARRRDTVTLRGRQQILANVTVMKEDCKEVQVDTTGDGVADRNVSQADVVRVDYGDAPQDFRRAMALFKLNRQHDKALEQFTKAASATGVRSWLKDYTAYYSAECVRRQAGSDAGALADAVKRYQGILRDNSNGPFRDGVLFGLGRTLLNQGKLDDARKQFERLERSGLKVEFKLGARLGLAEIFIREKQPDKALKQYDAALAGRKTGGVDLYRQAVVGKANVLIGLNQFDETTTFLKGVLKTNRSAKLFAEAYVALGDCHYKRAGTLKDEKKVRSAYKEALFNFLRVEVLYPQNPALLAKAFFFAGKCFQKLEQNERAGEKFGQLKKKFPKSPWTDKIR